MAGRLTATMVVDLKDQTGAGVRAVIGNMDRLKRAERDLELASRGAKLSNRDRAMERVLMERQHATNERRQRLEMWATRGTLAAAAIGVAAGKAYVDFAQTERRVNRMVINADKGADQIEPTIGRLQKVANDTRTSFDDVTGGLETLIASGRSLDESMAFLPAVAMTAQASGAALEDVALSADSLAGSLKINATDMQKAFDILVAGGKAGKFELKDMSQYLPTLLPAFAALGYTGTEGLQKIVAMLQVVRNQTGTSGEAATNLGNVFQKLYSQETAAKFKKLGIDLPKSLDKAKKSGKDVMDVFLDLTQQATKGDLSKLGNLFSDAEVQKGVRALLTQRDAMRSLNSELGRVDGSAQRDFNQILEDSASKIQRMSNLWGEFTTKVGAGVATVANPALEAVNNAIDDVSAQRKAQAGMSEEERNWQRNEFGKRYREQNPQAWFWEVNDALMKAQERVGRGEANSVFSDLDLQDARKRAEEINKRYPSQGSYGNRRVESEFPGGDHHYNARSLPKIGVPAPEGRPASGGTDALAFGAGYPSPGTYGAEQLAAEKERRDRASLKSLLTPLGARNQQPDGASTSSMMDFLFGEATRPDFNRRQQAGAFNSAFEPQTGGLSPTERDEGRSRGPQDVTIAGTPTVMIANPPPRPNITVSVVVNEVQDAAKIAEQIGRAVSEKMEGLQTNTTSGGGW